MWTHFTFVFQKSSNTYFYAIIRCNCFCVATKNIPNLLFDRLISSVSVSSNAYFHDVPHRGESHTHVAQNPSQSQIRCRSPPRLSRRSHHPLPIRLCLRRPIQTAPRLHAHALPAPQAPPCRLRLRPPRRLSLLRWSHRRGRRQDRHRAARPYQAPHAGASNATIFFIRR